MNMWEDRSEEEGLKKVCGHFAHNLFACGNNNVNCGRWPRGIVTLRCWSFFFFLVIYLCKMRLESYLTGRFLEWRFNTTEIRDSNWSSVFYIFRWCGGRAKGLAISVVGWIWVKYSCECQKKIANTNSRRRAFSFLFSLTYGESFL